MEKKKLFYGWYILAACVTIMALAYAPLVSCAGLFVRPITEELGFTRSAYTLNGTISSLVGVFLAPFMGKLLSRKHMHLCLAACVGGVAIFYSAFSLAYTLPQFYIISFFLGVFASGATLMPVSIVITQWFQKKRGLVMSIAMAGSSVGGFLLSPIIGRMITAFGWRQSYQYIGILMFLILVPVALFIIRLKPAEKNLTPYGYGEVSVGQNSEEKREWNVPLSQAKKTPVFWLFLFGVTTIMLTGGVISHIPASIVDAGYDTARAASIVSFYSFVAIFGKMVLGYIFDRYGTRVGVLFGNSAFLLSVICLLFIRNTPMLYLMALLYGFGTCIGTVSFPILTSSIFGTKHYGEIYGFSSMFTQLGSAFGVPFIASIFDATGNYETAWVVVAILAVLMTAALLYSIRAGKKKTGAALAPQAIGAD